MKISRVWAMPSKHTFSIPPIADFLDRWLQGCGIVIDPFAGDSQLANYQNDLNPHKKAIVHKDAREFLSDLSKQKVIADAILLDPPYSPRQMKECYQESGFRLTGKAQTQNATLLASVRNLASGLVTKGGLVLSFGWNSNGMGRHRGFHIEEILLVAHGGSHNDTICLVERKGGSNTSINC